MHRYTPWIVIAWAAACSPAPPSGIEGIGAVDRADGGGLPGIAAEAPLFGVVASDYTVTSISVLDADGEMLAADFIHAGSASAGLVTALSGDVTLPTRSGDPSVLTILDRFRTDVITRVDLATGDVLGQIKTHAANDAGKRAAYSSNPQDYVYFGAHDAWITRFEPNLDVSRDDPDRGIDLLHLDPTDLERGERISLWGLNGRATRVNPDTKETEEVTVYARPSSMVRLGERLVVGIVSVSATFDAIGDGMVVLVDPAEGTVEPVALPGLQSCGSVEPVPNDARRVVVACAGFYRGVRRTSAGLVILELDEGTLRIEHIWRGQEHLEAALAVDAVVPFGGSEVLAIAFGRSPDSVTAADGFARENDVAYVVDIATGGSSILFEADGAFKIGGGAYDPVSGLLLVPDASTDAEGRPTAGVRRFHRDASGAIESIDVVRIHDVLPPRQVRAL